MPGAPSTLPNFMSYLMKPKTAQSPPKDVVNSLKNKSENTPIARVTNDVRHPITQKWVRRDPTSLSNR